MAKKPTKKKADIEYFNKYASAIFVPRRVGPGESFMASESSAKIIKDFKEQDFI